MSYASLRILRADGRRQLDNVVRHSQEKSHETSNGDRHVCQEIHGACVSARTRLMNASSSSSEWKCVACPETTCSTRPSQASGSPGGWARSCTTKARLVGSGSGNWVMGDLLQHPIQAGHFHAVRGLPGREQLKKVAACSCAGRYTTLSVQGHTPKRSNVGVRCPGSVQRLFKL